MVANDGNGSLQRLSEKKEMKFYVTIDRDEDGIWTVEYPALPGCVSQGSGKEEALENIKEAISLCLEVRAQMAWPLTIETRQLEVENAVKSALDSCSESPPLAP